MRKFWKKFFKVSIISSTILIAFVLFYLGFSFVFSPVKFNKDKITNSNLIINVYDNQNRPLEHTYINGDFVKLNQIPMQTQECFISIEDKQFLARLQEGMSNYGNGDRYDWKTIAKQTLDFFNIN